MCDMQRAMCAPAAGTHYAVTATADAAHAQAAKDQYDSVIFGQSNDDDRLDNWHDFQRCTRHAKQTSETRQRRTFPRC